MKYTMIPLILLITLTTLTHALSEPKPIESFIETTGEYQWSNSERIVSIEEKNNRLQFSISLDGPDRKKTIGPKAGVLQPGKPWRFWIEGRNEIWMFDGDSRLWKYTFRTVKPKTYQDSISEIKDSGSIPSKLLRALPAQFVQSLKKI
ncbi:hypothetical protein JO972_13450 [Verrucomicrobiaceae bacterium 5K15]|uniref:Uncharacterized protein n=1 Tax=Oceaniferula flava TaxID=2800421 RepID=A0AAE2SG59_9BACT|nr:hypothetical protein [Oceaniferula flavus]MBK1855970.1 hypothetical protein [Oceaniferula flavus]MBM1137277.1 hypothetical protein [Oceaniferula flavus]